MQARLKTGWEGGLAVRSIGPRKKATPPAAAGDNLAGEYTRTDHERRQPFQAASRPLPFPRCRVGGKLFCEVRGWVVVRAMSDTPIVWPMTMRNGGGRPFLIICGGLVKAVKRESATAICHDFPQDNQSIALYSFSEYGRWAFYACFEDTTKVRIGREPDDPGEPGGPGEKAG